MPIIHVKCFLQRVEEVGLLPRGRWAGCWGDLTALRAQSHTPTRESRTDAQMVGQVQPKVLILKQYHGGEVGLRSSQWWLGPGDDTESGSMWGATLSIPWDGRAVPWGWGLILNVAKSMEERYVITLDLFIFIVSLLFIDACEDYQSVSFYLAVSEEQNKYFQQEYAPSWKVFNNGDSILCLIFWCKVTWAHALIFDNWQWKK